MDFNFVNARLATGAELSGVEDVEALIQGGITHVIDCRAEMDDGPLFKAIPNAISYLWAPTQDDGQPKPPEWFGQGIAFALPALAEERAKIYAHCAAGCNRGPSMLAAIIMALGFDEETTVAMIQKARPQAAIAYRDDAVAAVKALGYV